MKYSAARKLMGMMILVVMAFVFVANGNVSSAQTMQVEKSRENDLSAPFNGVSKKNSNLDIMFALDNSGSMMRSDPEFITRKVVLNFLNGLADGARVGMVVFDETARMASPLTEIQETTMESKFLNLLDMIDYKGRYTDTPAGVERAVYELKTFGRKGAQKLIILLTDGIVDTGDKSRDQERAEWLRRDLSQESKAAGIRIFGIAFTDNADFQLIQSLSSRTGGAYFRAYEVKDISPVLDRVMEIVLRPTEENTPQPSLEKKLWAPAPDPGASSRHAVAESGPARDKKNPMPLLISAVAVGLLVLVLLAALKRKPLKTAVSDVPDRVPEEKLPPDHPIFKAELIDVDHIVSDDSLSLDLNKLLVTIGRDPNNDIVIPKESISSLHASIEYKNGYFYLEDHRSTNGTRLNHKDLEENKPARLKSGDKIHFAVYEFRFLLPDQAPFGETVYLKKESL